MFRLAIQRSASLRVPVNGTRRGLASSLLTRSRDDWTHSQLKKEAKDRGLMYSGNKAALLARLHEDDLSRGGKNISTSQPNLAKAKASSPATEPASTVVAPESTPVSAPARAPFKSTRTVKGPSPSTTTPGIPEDRNPFAPRRSAPLNVQIPSEEEPELDGPIIPVLPENPKAAVASESEIPSSVGEPPKVVSLSGVDEHLAAPSHPNPTVVVSPPVEAPTTSGQTAAQVSSTSTTSTVTPSEDVGQWSESGNSSSSSSEKLSSDERRGLLVLGGILLGGWFAGGVAKKEGLKLEGSTSHH